MKYSRMVANETNYHNNQEARRMVANDINPSDLRKAAKETKTSANCFEATAHECWEHNKHTWTKRPLFLNSLGA
jgi:hypothetical protein